MRVYGSTIDGQTRCVHYGTELDVIAIKFVCCGRYYPCYECHSENETHAAEQWPAARWSELAVLCGVCDTEMSIDAYRGALACPACAAPFNPRCSLHAHLYFAAASPG